MCVYVYVWINWRLISNVLCGKKESSRVEDKFNRVLGRLTMLYGVGFGQSGTYIQKMSVA